MRVDRLSQNLPELSRMVGVRRSAPEPPRGLRLGQAGFVQWEAPSDVFGITHYRIYKNDDSAAGLFMEVPSSQLNAFVGAATEILVSSYSKPAGVESYPIALGQAVSSGSGAGAASEAFTITTAVTNITVVNAVVDGGFLYVVIEQDATGGRLITWDAAQFVSTTPDNIALEPLARTIYGFMGIGGLWNVISVQNPTG